LLSVLEVEKRFGAVTALKNASLQIMPGEIRALLGANGSGKSTLVKILGGLVSRDSGSILLDEKPLAIRSPRDSRGHGIAVAYQDLSLVPMLSVADNIMLGREPRGRAGFLERETIRKTAFALLERLKADFSTSTFCNVLDASQLGQVEIAKAFAWKARYLLLDEVTASLHHDQVKVLFDILREMRDSGTAVLFVSHRLDEVFELCAAATILRGGESVASVALGEVDHSDLAFHMMGKRLERAEARRREDQAVRETRPVLLVRDLALPPKVRGVSIELHPGEIVGLGGLQGQGQSEFLKAVYGAIPHAAGTIEVNGVPVRFHEPADALRRGLGFIPGDRDREGVLPIRSVTENIFLARMALTRLGARIRPRKLLEGAREMIAKLSIRVASPAYPARSLSGGNQQKLIVGRWLLISPKVLLLDDPTKGVDIGARREIHVLLRQMAQDGCAVLLSSSENEELLALADRIYVFYEGRITEELGGDRRTEAKLVSAMLGVGRPPVTEAVS
jgi:ABC-type sugar transport system ATPase subunit